VSEQGRQPEASSSPGASGSLDLGSLLSQFGQMQRSLKAAQEAAAGQEVEGTSGGGAVRIRVSGAMQLLSVRIDPSVVNPAEVEMLEDLVLAAARDGLEKAADLAAQAVGGAALPGLGGGSLGDVLGGLFGPEGGPGGAAPGVSPPPGAPPAPDPG
jgi:DNA-binding YbaB/EbfC family protein